MKSLTIKFILFNILISVIAVAQFAILYNYSILNNYYGNESIFLSENIEVSVTHLLMGLLGTQAVLIVVTIFVAFIEIKKLKEVSTRLFTSLIAVISANFVCIGIVLLSAPLFNTISILLCATFIFIGLLFFIVFGVIFWDEDKREGVSTVLIVYKLLVNVIVYLVGVYTSLVIYS